MNSETRTGQEAEMSMAGGLSTDLLTPKPTPVPFPAAEGQDEQPKSGS